MTSAKDRQRVRQSHLDHACSFTCIGEGQIGGLAWAQMAASHCGCLGINRVPFSKNMIKILSIWGLTGLKWPLTGYICAIIGERMTTAKVSEAELDNAKRAAEKYVESQIEHSDFSDEEKKAMKKDYKLWAESALQGMKKRLRDSGRLLWCSSRQTIAILLRQHSSATPCG